MKKVVLLSLVFLVLGIASQANLYTVTVMNFQFTPSTVTAVIGDTVRWQWVGGSHTTTGDPSMESSIVLPAGAQPWSHDMNSGSTTFDYVIQVAGFYHYVCLPHSPNMSGNINGVLPLKLTSLLVSGSGNNVTVKWGVESEEDVDYYSVRRSANGAEFQEAGRVATAGNSATAKTYSFSDKISSKQKYAYYNVGVIYKDGKKTYSEIKLYRNGEAPVKLITSLSPNPISRPGHLMMTFNSEAEGKMDVMVADAAGKIIVNTQMQAVAGVNNGHVHLGVLAPGTYTLVCSMNGVKETHRLIYK